MRRVVKDKGGWRTEPHIQIDLEKARRETRDVIQGNVPFHVDPFAKPVETPLPEITLRECYCAFVGGECDACKDLDA